MNISKEFLEHQVQQAEIAVAKEQAKLEQARGCLSVLKQLLAIVNTPEPEKPDAPEQPIGIPAA